MKNQIFKYFAFLLLIIISACSADYDEAKEEVNSNLELVKELRKLQYSVKMDGSILLQSNALGLGNSQTRKVAISERKSESDRLKSNKSMEIFDGSRTSVKFENNTPNPQFENLFGKTLHYSIYEEGQRSGAAGDSIYIPELISVNFSSDFIEVGSTISWNADNLNPRGVVVYITYDPLHQLNGNIAWENQYRISEAFVVEDSQGSYQVTQQDVERFPDDAMLSIRVSRGAYQVDDQEPSFIAITSVRNDMNLKK